MPSDRLLHVFRAQHRLRPPDLQRLSSADLREVEAAVAGTAHRGYRVRAMDALVSARGAGATRALSRIVAEKGEPDTVRAAAASQLGRVGATGEVALLKALEAEQPAIAMAAAGALARAGSERAIERLAPLADRDDLLGQQARFARTLIAFRLGVRGHEPPAASERKTLPVPREGRTAVVHRLLGRDEAIAALTDVRHDGFRLDASPENATGIDCGRERLVIALDVRSARVEGPSLVAAAARRAEAQDTYSVSWLVLAWPVEGSATEVGVYRPSGHQVLAGTATAEGGRASFELRSVEGRGNFPIEVRGSVANARLVELEGVSAASRPVRGAPQPE